MDALRLPRTGDHRILAWTTLLVGLALVGSLAVVPAASSVTVTSAWQAKIGPRGVNGTAKVQVLNTGTGSLALKLVKMRPATLLPVVLHKGTCSAVGPVLTRLDSIRSSSAGAATRTLSLTAIRVRALIAATRSGKVAIRIGSGSAVRCGVFVALAVAAPPTPSPSPGGTMFMGPYFTLAVPAGWSPSSDGEPSLTKVVFAGPGTQRLLADSVAMTLTLDDLVTLMIAAVKIGNGVDPEQNEAITMAGVPGRLFAYHFARNGVSRYEIDAYCVSNGRGYELSFSNTAGTESADRALFLDILASFGFGPGF